MTPTRLGFVVLSLVTAVGCGFIGAPDRASDTQNLNAISDDISALSMLLILFTAALVLLVERSLGFVRAFGR